MNSSRDNSADGIPRVLFVCTGNAARSVMAVAVARSRTARAEVWGAGTHSIEGLPMSQRTRRALAAFGLSDPDHLSHQLSEDDVARADVIVVFEPNHVSYVRRRHAEGAAITAMLPSWIRAIDDGPDLAGVAFDERVAALRLADDDAPADEEVIDPAGGDQAVFDASLHEISLLLDALLDAFGIHDGPRHSDQAPA